MNAQDVDRKHTIRVLETQVTVGNNEHEAAVLREAAEILRKRVDASNSTRGPADAGAPMDDKLTR